MKQNPKDELVKIIHDCSSISWKLTTNFKEGNEELVKRDVMVLRVMLKLLQIRLNYYYKHENTEVNENQLRNDK